MLRLLAWENSFFIFLPHVYSINHPNAPHLLWEQAEENGYDAAQHSSHLAKTNNCRASRGSGVMKCTVSVPFTDLLIYICCRVQLHPVAPPSTQQQQAWEGQPVCI